MGLERAVSDPARSIIVASMLALLTWNKSPPGQLSLIDPRAGDARDERPPTEGFPAEKQPPNRCLLPGLVTTSLDFNRVTKYNSRPFSRLDRVDQRK